MRTLILCLSALSFSLVAQTSIPRPEHPRPQFERERWINLNGEWDFAIDAVNSGSEKGWLTDAGAFDRTILVPFPPESTLSGIEHTDFMDAVWYRRDVAVPADWDGERVFLHFGAADYKTEVWVNGRDVGTHYGGSTSFEFEITEALREGGNEIVVKCTDDIRSGNQPAGKQSATYANDGCCKYTRVTGIWQTVWLEARPESYLATARVIPDLDNSRFSIQPTFDRQRSGQRFRATLRDADGREVASETIVANNHNLLVLSVDTPRSWSPGDPHLYDLELELLDGSGSTIDRVESYAGLRKIHTEGNRIYLNNEPIFLRWILDQGFYPEGVWSAPSDADLRRDIELSMAAGFNGARLHEKVFEERFHYWADRLGYLTSAEFPDWGIQRTYLEPEAVLNMQREWRQSMQRDWNHPSIIMWTPMNETHSAKRGLEEYERVNREMYALTKALDPTRPVNTVSGFLNIITDIWTVHDYSQNPEAMAADYARLPDTSRIVSWGWYNNGRVMRDYDYSYDTLEARIPFVMNEYGGTFWTPEYARQPARGNGRSEWGYGKSRGEVTERIAALTQLLLDNPNISGLVYTQLTDVQQEVNGLYSYDRAPKFDVARLREIFAGPAAIEREGGE
jgi:beta-galactosidase/beta-glucuronidase